MPDHPSTAEIRARLDKAKAMRFETSLNAYAGHFDTDTERHLYNLAGRCWNALQAAIKDLDLYVGKEPTLAEEMQYVGSCLDAVYDLVNGAKKRGHEVVTTAEVEQAASGDWPRDPKDNRRRIYIDGQGCAWIDQSTDPDGTQYIVPIDSHSVGDEPSDDIRKRTGGLREIGRAW